MALDIRRLEPSADVKQFDCGDADLNRYIRQFALENQERHMYGTTYVAYSEDGALLGYYTIATTSVPLAVLPPEQTQGAPKYPEIPAFLLARLAVDKSQQKKRNGEQLLRHFLTKALQLSEGAGARYVITDAYPKKVGWYKRYGFRELTGTSSARTTRMFLDLAVVKAAVVKGCDG